MINARQSNKVWVVGKHDCFDFECTSKSGFTYLLFHNDKINQTVEIRKMFRFGSQTAQHLVKSNMNN